MPSKIPFEPKSYCATAPPPFYVNGECNKQYISELLSNWSGAGGKEKIIG